MIDDLRALAIFVRVAEAGSFSSAASSLRLSASVVSHHIKGLETRHGVSLIRRSTRALSLTHEGEKLLVSAKSMVEAAESGLNGIAGASLEPAGVLRVTMPSFLVNSAQESAIWEFANRYPNVNLSLYGTEERVNLVADGFDLAIRVGSLSDSGLKSRKIGKFERCLVASPAYLGRSKKITTPQALADCDFVQLDMLPAKITLIRGKKKVAVTPENTKLLVNSVAAARSAVIAGLGIQRLPLSEVEEDINNGKLARVLPQWSLPVLNIYAVWPESGQRSSLISLLLEALVGGDK